jgi:hypothetical protein
MKALKITGFEPIGIVLISRLIIPLFVIVRKRSTNHTLSRG